MALMFEDERSFPDNAARANFVFMGYPFNPPLPRDDYGAVVTELQEELPVRFWYFLDEVTTDEMMRKVWRAILRSDLAVFDITGGNANVAFELGLAVAINKRCMTMLKTGQANPLGTVDLGYAERIEYTSRLGTSSGWASFPAEVGTARPDAPRPTGRASPVGPRGRDSRVAPWVPASHFSRAWVPAHAQWPVRGLGDQDGAPRLASSVACISRIS